MSKTMRHERREPVEREFPYAPTFPYIPSRVPMLQVGRPYGAADNRAYVRQLLKANNPVMSNRLEHEWDMVDDELSAGMIQLDEAIFRLRIV
jgi:hypothetical protein